MSADRLLKLRVTLKGRPVRTYSFDKEVVRIGRDPAADVFLDNPGISREHLRLEVTPDGFYQAQDLGSANGTLLNELPVVRQRLEHNDVLRIGKYSLWLTYEEDRRGQVVPVAATGTDDGTMVLSYTELQGMIEKARLSEASEGAGGAESDLRVVPGGAGRPASSQGRGSAVLVYLLGVLTGAVLATAAWQIFFRIR